MTDTYPYVMVNGKTGKLLEAIGNAAKPARFSYEFLRTIGFGSSNDRAFVSLFRHLGLINENGAPTTAYDEIRDPSRRPYALGDLIKQAYADLFAVNTNIHKASDADIRAAISRVTGKDAAYVGRAYILIFALENSARELIADRLRERKGAIWWDSVPAGIRKKVADLRSKEKTNRYHTDRSTELLGYTFFANLAQTIIANWDEFSDLFPDQAWVTSRFNDLELSRNIVMHTGVLPEFEVDRVESIARDWLRQVG